MQLPKWLKTVLEAVGWKYCYWLHVRNWRFKGGTLVHKKTWKLAAVAIKGDKNIAIEKVRELKRIGC